MPPCVPLSLQSPSITTACPCSLCGRLTSSPPPAPAPILSLHHGLSAAQNSRRELCPDTSGPATPLSREAHSGLLPLLSAQSPAPSRRGHTRPRAPRVQLPLQRLSYPFSRIPKPPLCSLLRFLINQPKGHCHYLVPPSPFTLTFTSSPLPPLQSDQLRSPSGLIPQGPFLQSPPPHPCAPGTPPPPPVWGGQPVGTAAPREGGAMSDHSRAHPRAWTWTSRGRTQSLWSRQELSDPYQGPARLIVTPLPPSCPC